MSCTDTSQGNPQGLLISTNKDLVQPQKKHFMIECASSGKIWYRIKDHSDNHVCPQKWKHARQGYIGRCN